MFLDVLDGQAAESDRLLAAELAGDVTVINDELVEHMNAGALEKLASLTSGKTPCVVAVSTR